MIEVLREVPRDALPFFVRDALGDGREGFVKGGRGRCRAQHRDRTCIVLDDNFVASAYMIQQRGKIACRFRGRDVDHTVSHTLIIH